MERLDKTLSKQLNIARSEAKALIKKGSVTVNGALAVSGDMKCADSDVISVDGKKIIAPDNSADYEDRDKNFPYKITADDLCCKLFRERGFLWGGDCWDDEKDYQHFFIN